MAKKPVQKMPERVDVAKGSTKNAENVGALPFKKGGKVSNMSRRFGKKSGC